MSWTWRRKWAKGGSHRWKLWGVVLPPILVLILVPFWLFGSRLDAWAAGLFGAHGAGGITFAVVVFLLAIDIALPIPSSVVSTMAGAVLGAPLGAAASWFGMTLGTLAGYYVGSKAGRPLVGTMIDSPSLDALEEDVVRHGAWLVAVGRAIPVLAEATTLVAGLSRMPFARFVMVSSLANLGVSLVYATVGAFSASTGSFLLALGGSLVLPAVSWWLVRRWPSRSRASGAGRSVPG